MPLLIGELGGFSDVPGTTTGSERPIVEAYVRTHAQRGAGEPLVHRYDRETRGMVLTLRNRRRVPGGR